MDERERWWAAGFFEGEGWFGSARSRSRGRYGKRYLSLSASQKESEPLSLMHRLFGGSLSGPDTHGMFHWRVQGRRAEEAAETLRPLLSERRQGQLDRHKATVGFDLKRAQRQFRALGRERRRLKGKAEFVPKAGHRAKVYDLAAARRRKEANRDR